MAAFVLLEAAYLRSDFSFALVAESSSTDTPTFYKLTGMWSTPGGLAAAVGLLLSLFSSAVLFVTRRTQREIVPYATAVLGGGGRVLPALMVVWESPFGTLADRAGRGQRASTRCCATRR